MSEPRTPLDEERVDPKIGKVLAGRYRLDRVIGQGGLGRVYEAAHLTLNAPVAVKFILEGAASAEARARFKREAAALSLLRHPGIVAAHDFGDDEGDLYIVMEFVRGHSLSDDIRSAESGMEYPRVATIIEQILQVVEAAHNAHIVHRDLKPENVMLLDAQDRAVHVKVLDFGIALMDDRAGDARLTATNAVQGTPLYMSPEQCRGRDVGPPTDVYAVGVILFEMLAGVTPFSGDSLVDVMAQHMFVLPPSIAERSAGRQVPAELERLAMWALSKKPEDRPTATQLRDALGNMTRGTGATQLAARSTEERIRAMGLTRNERGLPAAHGIAHAQTEISVSAPPIDPKAAGSESLEGRPLVLLCDFDAERASHLKSTFAVNGIEARIWSGDDPSTAGAARAVIIGASRASERAVERLVAFRASTPLAHLPLLVADVAAATDSPALVRAGASDIGLSAIGDDVLCKKVLRLLRRRTT